MDVTANDPDYEDILNQVIKKITEINHLATLLPLHIQADVYSAAKRHFYIAQCSTNKELKKVKYGSDKQ